MTNSLAFHSFESDKRTRKQFFDDWCESQANLARADVLLDELKEKFNSTSKAYDQMVTSNNKLAGKMKVELEKNLEHSSTIQELTEKVELLEEVRAELLNRLDSTTEQFITFSQVTSHIRHGVKEHNREFPLALKDCGKALEATAKVLLPVFDRAYAFANSSKSFFKD
tara:strand:+ start:104 stop:607 length:504 start_codon:yes stop_codon:yes gene_type:complete